MDANERKLKELIRKGEGISTEFKTCRNSQSEAQVFPEAPSKHPASNPASKKVDCKNLGRDGTSRIDECVVIERPGELCAKLP
jgi:hypothetical protein